MTDYYCMCIMTGPGQYGHKALDNQVYMAPNRFLPGVDSKDDDNLKPDAVVLMRKMTVVKNGLEHRITNHGKPMPNTHPQTSGRKYADRSDLRDNTFKHYPNADMYHCKRCGAIICVA